MAQEGPLCAANCLTESCRDAFGDERVCFCQFPKVEYSGGCVLGPSCCPKREESEGQRAAPF